MGGLVLILGAAILGTGADPARVDPDQAIWKLDEAGLYRVGRVYRGKPEEAS
jgi:hypothetical protein